MPVPYAASRQDVKINLGYIDSRSVSYLKRATSHSSPILLATYTQPEPTVFDAVMRTYLACWQGNFGLAVRAPANSRGRPASDRDPVLRLRAGAPGVAQGRDELGRGVSCQGCTQQTLSAQKRQEHGSTSSRLASAPRAGTARARFLPRPFTCPSRRVSEVVGRSACGGPAAPPGFSRARAAARSSAPALSAWPSVARQSKGPSPWSPRSAAPARP